MAIFCILVGVVSLCCLFEWNERRDRPKRRAYIVKYYNYLLRLESENREMLNIMRDRAKNEPIMNQKKVEHYEMDLHFWVTLIKYPEKFELCEKTKNEI